MDAALITAISTSVVGIAGMLATWATAKYQTVNETVKAREERRFQFANTQRQERMQLYSQFLKVETDTVREIVIAAVLLSSREHETSPLYAKVQGRISEVEISAHSIALISGDEVGTLAEGLALALFYAWKQAVDNVGDKDKKYDRDFIADASKIEKRLKHAMIAEMRAETEETSQLQGLKK